MTSVGGKPKATGIAVVTAAVSILLGMIVCLTLLAVTPGYQVHVPLFHLYSEVVGIDLLGALFPVLLSLVLAFEFGRPGAFNGARPFRGRRFWVPVLLLASVLVVVFGYLKASSRTLSLTPLQATVAIPVCGVFGIAYVVQRKGKLPASVTSVEAYVVGVFGTFASDLALSLSGWSRLRGGTLVWGGNGLHDLILWLGLYMALPAFIYQKFSPVLAEALSNLEKRVRPRSEAQEAEPVQPTKGR